MSSAGPGRREVAHRIFAAEYDDATLEYAESDEERAPNYVVTPSGTRINRLFVVGVLTAVEQVNDDTVRARIADPTGAFVVYAGQYQPDELAALQSLEAPAFVAVTGKANTFAPEGSDRVLTSVRPESVTEVGAETRDRWVTATAEHTLARIQTTASALAKDERGEALRAALLRDGVEPGFAEGIARALDHYDTTADYLGALRDLAIQSLEVVSGERSEVEALELDPDAGDGTATAADLADLLGEDRRAVTRAAGDVDVDALVGEDDGAETSESEPESTESADEEPADGAAADQAPVGEEPPGQETADADADSSETVATTADEAAESSSDDAEAQPAEDDEATPDPEPETSEAAVAETAAEAEEAAEAKESESEGPGAEESGADGATSEPEPETSETAAEETAEDAERAANDEIYEFDEEEREQIEEEHGVEFQSGTEVDPAGEADIETEDAQPDTEADDGSPEESGPESESEADEANEGEEEAAADDDVGESADESEDTGEDAEDGVDLEAVLVDEMDALDDGDGADREALVDAVADETGADADAIDDAIDDLLMSGQCYEPSEGTLKPI